MSASETQEWLETCLAEEDHLSDRQADILRAVCDNGNPLWVVEISKDVGEFELRRGLTAEAYLPSRRFLRDLAALEIRGWIHVDGGLIEPTFPGPLPETFDAEEIERRLAEYEEEDRG
jgi:hypothetical protein